MNEHVEKMFELSIKLKDKTMPRLKELEDQYGQDDFRTALIARPVNCVINQIFTHRSNEVSFYSHDWWDKLGVKEEGRLGFAEAHDIFIKFMSFIQFFSYVEHQMRVLIRKFRPGSCRDGKSTFDSIFTKVLNDLSLNKYLELFKFCSAIRNSIHNGGYYLPSNNDNDADFSFRGENYEFNYDEELDFIFPELVVEIQDEMLDCMYEIAFHPEIKAISTR